MFASLRLVFFPLLDVVARAYIQLLGLTANKNPGL